MEKLRIDKWLWAARFYKTRTLASEEIVKGRVEVNGQEAKPAREVKVGDTVSLRREAGHAHGGRQGPVRHARPGAGGAAALRGNRREHEGAPAGGASSAALRPSRRCRSSMAARPSAGGANWTKPPGLGRPLERLVEGLERLLPDGCGPCRGCVMKLGHREAGPMGERDQLERVRTGRLLPPGVDGAVEKVDLVGDIAAEGLEKVGMFVGTDRRAPARPH